MFGTKKSEGRDFRGWYSAIQFRRAMERERARADRWEQQLVLLSFGAKRARDRHATLLHVARHLQHRMRVTDEAGWLDDRHIGILMPQTPAWGGWTLADEVCLAIPDGVALPECRVYCYPSNWFGAPSADVQAPAEIPMANGRVGAMELLFFQRLPRWKRAVDVLGAAILLLMLLPLMLFVALVVKLTSRGPMLFAQARAGLGGRPFVMYKFRTMVVDAEARKESLQALNEQDGPAFKLQNDPRITRVGRFLRQTSIDELPQLWNVLRGEMSLVGPRPLPCKESDARQGWQRQRLDVTPGLTCVWQVSGRARARVSFADWMRMDMRYIRARSPRRDLALLLKTVLVVFSRRGTSPAPSTPRASP